MANAEVYRKKFDLFKVCVIIPTFNNAATLNDVIDSVSDYTNNLIVVDDGSTDDTSELLNGLPRIHKISYTPNRGKGWALRTGFRLAIEQGYQYAITIDADGQHFASDLPKFIDSLEACGPELVIGSRNMAQTGIPGKSSFGNKFSNFWFKVETGISMPDTQSGYRLYPIDRMKKMRFITRKYEFEIEAIVRAAWSGIPIRAIPVDVYYAPKSERISHFRPFRDFTRISILNTFLVLIAVFYIKPRDFIRTLFNRQKLKQFADDILLNNEQSDLLKSASVAFGIFMGIIPIWGFQLVAAIFLAFVLRLNKALVIVFANISIPPMIPVIIYLSYQCGAYWMGNAATHIGFSNNITIAAIRRNFEQYLYGSITLAVVAALTSGIMSYLLIKLFRGKRAAKVRS